MNQKQEEDIIYLATTAAGNIMRAQKLEGKDATYYLTGEVKRALQEMLKEQEKPAIFVEMHSYQIKSVSANRDIDIYVMDKDMLQSGNIDDLETLKETVEEPFHLNTTSTDINNKIDQAMREIEAVIEEVRGDAKLEGEMHRPDDWRGDATKDEKPGRFHAETASNKPEGLPRVINILDKILDTLEKFVDKE